MTDVRTLDIAPIAYAQISADWLPDLANAIRRD